MANIAEEAALTKGAVYSNFESKEDLFLALMQESDPEWTAPHDVATTAGDEAVRALPASAATPRRSAPADAT